MAYISGFILVDAPASALNNAGTVEGRTDNVVAVKAIRTRSGLYPYVSAQAFRNWLRTTLEADREGGWRASPIFRETKIAYTDANPIDYWDDDLFGYMRAPGTKADQKADRETRLEASAMTEIKTDVTRVSPFRMGTLVSIAPTTPTSDFGTMSRHDGDPVPHEHQFYRAVLKGMFSVNLGAAGVFTYRSKAGYKNLDEIRLEKARDAGLEHDEKAKTYRLPSAERARRVATLLRGMSIISGGAKLALHYSDVTPVVVVAAVVKGGNNPLNYIIGSSDTAAPRVSPEALKEAVRSWGDQILSPLYVGWVQGFYDDQRQTLFSALGEVAADSGLRQPPLTYQFDHPRQVLERLAQDLLDNAGTWME